MTYKEFKVAFNHEQGKKVLHGKPVRLTASQLNTGEPHYFHPENYKKLVKAFESHKGLTLHMTHGEVLRTHQSGLTGSGFWDNLWSGIKKGASVGWKFLKDNWKPLAGMAMDAGVKAYPEAAPLRGLVKEVSGVGLEPEPVAVKSKRKRRIGPSGSFRLN